MNSTSEARSPQNRKPFFGVRSYFSLWLQWLVASLVAGFVGLIAGIMVYVGTVLLVAGLDFQVASTKPWLYLQEVLSYLVVGGFIGLSLATAQKMVILRYVDLLSWYIRSSTIGAVLALLLYSSNEIGPHLVAPPLVAAMGGTIFGFSQWLVLRHGLRHSGWWIPANTVAWGIGGTIMYSLLEPWTYTGGSDPLPGYGIFLDTCGLPMVCAGTTAVITGFVLVWLLRASSSPYTSSQPPDLVSPS